MRDLFRVRKRANFGALVKGASFQKVEHFEFSIAMDYEGILKKEIFLKATVKNRVGL